MSPILTKLGPYAKTVAAVVIGLIGWATAVITSEPSAITSAEWLGLATVLATALGVYGVSNTTAE